MPLASAQVEINSTQVEHVICFIGTGYQIHLISRRLNRISALRTSIATARLGQNPSLTKLGDEFYSVLPCSIKCISKIAEHLQPIAICGAKIRIDVRAIKPIKPQEDQVIAGALHCERNGVRCLLNLIASWFRLPFSSSNRKLSATKIGYSEAFNSRAQCFAHHHRSPHEVGFRHWLTHSDSRRCRFDTESK